MSYSMNPFHHSHACNEMKLFNKAFFANRRNSPPKYDVLWKQAIYHFSHSFTYFFMGCEKRSTLNDVWASKECLNVNRRWRTEVKKKLKAHEKRFNKHFSLPPLLEWISINGWTHEKSQNHSQSFYHFHELAEARMTAFIKRGVFERNWTQFYCEVSIICKWPLKVPNKLFINNFYMHEHLFVKYSQTYQSKGKTFNCKIQQLKCLFKIN